MTELLEDTVSELDKLIEEIGGEDSDGDVVEKADPSQHAPEQPAVDPGLLVVQELERIRKELKEERAGGAKSGDEPEPPVKIDLPEISDDELGGVAPYREVLQKLAKAAVGKEFEALAEYLHQLDKRIAEFEQRQREQANQSFAMMLRAAIPDIDALTKDSAFTDYLSQPAPLSGGRTIGELLEEAYAAQDLARVREIISNFKQTKVQKHTDGAPAPDTSAAARPGFSEAPSGVPAAQGAQDLESKMAKLHEAYQKLNMLYQRGHLAYEDYVARVKKLDELSAKLMS